MSKASRVAQVQARELVELRSLVAGPVYARGEEGYDIEVSGFNTIAPTNPAVVVGAIDERDVVEAVKWAARHGITVHPQATGHGAYRKLDHGMLLKTSRLRGLTVDAPNRRWTMGAGLRWRDILPALHAAGLGAVTGSAPGVGPVGLTLGGGISPIGRTFGLAGDWVRGYRVVTADGQAREVGPDRHPDLFWALRGGKVGLGVITEMTFEALPMPFLYAGGMYYGEADVDRLMHLWLEWVQDVPESVSTSFAVVRLPEALPAPLGGRTWFHFRFAHVELGTSPAELRRRGEELLAGWRARAGTPVIDGVGVLASDRVGEIHADPTDPLPLYEYGEFLDRFDHDLADRLLTYVGSGVDSPITSLEVRYHGGAYAREPLHASAIGGREALFTFLIVAHPDEVALTTSSMDDVANAVRADLGEYASPYVNANWANPLTRQRFDNRLWRPEVSDRLRRIRAEIDPRGLFEFGFNEEMTAADRTRREAS